MRSTSPEQGGGVVRRALGRASIVTGLVVGLSVIAIALTPEPDEPPGARRLAVPASEIIVQLLAVAGVFGFCFLVAVLVLARRGAAAQHRARLRGRAVGRTGTTTASAPDPRGRARR